jgi:hypothetical protein
VIDILTALERRIHDYSIKAVLCSIRVNVKVVAAEKAHAIHPFVLAAKNIEKKAIQFAIRNPDILMVFEDCINQVAGPC